MDNKSCHTCSGEQVVTSVDTCAAVAPVYLEYEARLRSFVMKRVKDKDEANDILQQLYVKLYKHCEQLQEVRNMNAWLYQIARNAVYDYFREQGRSIPVEDEGKLEEQLQQDSEHQDSESLVLPLINMLPVEYAEPLRLSEIEGISQKEIAERLGMSYSGAKSRVQRGREKLKELFLECCHLELDRKGALVSATAKESCRPLQVQLKGA
ncbi:RNA polymerase sigma factor SigZ [Pontibacter sp. HSC-36F09]|uniref:RNA polymerase sigma factor SigZ n=1 Tax=Pontibacter sp. HSC-36F09 TaxID=2910966 RepID=UPI00209D4CB2|nr:RNA polymerase sigma factor SigZ [Pontibacter sp. HSC-36F09]MCP2043458.1 RNA polymerase sigma-70 factor (ECF subfamily) [Pontibacter sp. HSC-36F09]